MRKLGAALLILALLTGGWLRFAGLGATEMSADEGASWAAASAHDVGQVVALQLRLNPGKLALHELALHAWMLAFGDGIEAMRSLSALCGIFAVALTFLVTRELLILAPDNSEPRTDLAAPDAIAGAAALLVAVSLITIKYSREARMYPMQLALLVAQAAMFVRVRRRGGVANWVVLAVLTALAFAANFSSVLVYAAEAVWVVILFGRIRFQLLAPSARRGWLLIAALAAGGVLIAPFLPGAIRTQVAASRAGVWHWIPMPPLWQPFSLFNKGLGTFPFPVVGLLGAWGVYRGWKRWRDAVIFSLLWMLIPVVLLMIVSYTVQPALVERYVLSSFIPFFILAAIGVAELPWAQARAAALILAVILALGHVATHRNRFRFHDVLWREAGAAAFDHLTAGAEVAVAPAYAVAVVRYYLPADERARARSASSAPTEPLLILGPQGGMYPGRCAALIRRYPREIASFRGVSVRALPAPALATLRPGH